MVTAVPYLETVMAMDHALRSDSPRDGSSECWPASCQVRRGSDFDCICKQGVKMLSVTEGCAKLIFLEKFGK